MRNDSAHTHAVVAAFLARRAARAEGMVDSPSEERGEGIVDPAAPRRIMTRDEAVALVQFVREVINRPTENLQISHRATAVALRTPDAFPRCMDVDEFQLRWVVRLGHLTWAEGLVGVATDVRDLDTLRHVLLHAVRPLPDPPPSPEELEDRAAWEKMFTPHPLTYLPLTTWHANTAAAAETQRGAMLARLLAPLEGTPWRGAGTVVVSQVGYCAVNHAMRVTQWGESTDSEISLTAHSADGATSGWSGHAHRDWDKLEPERVAREALAAATQQLHAVRAEPGRYTAILSATAVGQLLQRMAELFDVRSASPFSVRGQMATDRGHRGERLFDPRITLTTDPTDPEGGDFPFFPEGAPFPSGKVTWVENGVLKRRSVNLDSAFTLGMTPVREPQCIRMSGGPTSVDEMIAQCERGIYVHRFATIRMVDLWSGTMEGFTRDGCLLIQNGKITHPVTDFRFYESPFLSFNRVMALGTPRRVAFGFTLRDGEQWPHAPVVAPPLMVRDFNFSALADNA